MRVGIDIVRIKRIEKLLVEPEAARKIFNESEICDNPEKMAGILAAKEAYFKAIGEKGDWLVLTVRNKESGEPVLEVENQEKISLSISHDGDYAVAVVMIG